MAVISSDFDPGHPVDRVLSRLKGVRHLAPGRWMALCPAHPDRRPSLSVRDSNGQVLLHCFAECETRAILDAIGLQLRDLYPQPIGHAVPSVRDRSHWHGTRAALEVLRDEARIILISASDVVEGRPLQAADAERVATAAARIARAVEELYGSR